MLGTAFVLGAYPVGHEPDNAYRILNHLPDRLNPVYFYHMLAAALLIMGIWLLEPLGKALSKKPVLFLGKISYSLYLVHIPVIYSLSAWLLVKFMAGTGNYNLSAGLSFAISLPVMILLAWLFYRFIEKNCTRLINKAVDKLTEEESQKKHDGVKSK